MNKLFKVNVYNFQGIDYREIDSTEFVYSINTNI